LKSPSRRAAKEQKLVSTGGRFTTLDETGDHVELLPGTDLEGITFRAE
jgi:hypothetical protein